MQEKEPDDQEERHIESAKSSLKTYAKYSAMGFQMIAIIGLFTYGGYKLDEHRDSELPLYTAFLSLAGVFIALYLIIRSVKKTKS